MSTVLVITTTFTSLAAFFVSIRLWMRLRLIRAPGWDDLLIFTALVVLAEMNNKCRLICIDFQFCILRLCNGW